MSRIISREATGELSVEEFSEDFSFDNSGKLLSIYVKTSVDVTEQVTISYKSSKGDEYNAVIA